MIRIAFAIVLAGMAVAGSAQARSMKDCDRLRDADAYNKCLASFGPREHGPHNLRTPATSQIPDSDDPAPGARRTSAAGPRAYRRSRSARRGRVSHNGLLVQRVGKRVRVIIPRRR